MKTRATAHPALALLLTLVTAACGDGIVDAGGPGDPPPDTLVSGVYVLASVDGRPLPVVVFDGEVALPEGRFRLRAVAAEGALELVPEGGYRERIRHVLTVDGNPAPGGAWTDEGGWLARGERVIFESSLVQNVRFEAARLASGLELVRDYVGEGRTAVYRFEKGMIALERGRIAPAAASPYPWR